MLRGFVVSGLKPKRTRQVGVNRPLSGYGGPVRLRSSQDARALSTRFHPSVPQPRQDVVSHFHQALASASPKCSTIRPYRTSRSTPPGIAGSAWDGATISAGQSGAGLISGSVPGCDAVV